MHWRNCGEWKYGMPAGTRLEPVSQTIPFSEFRGLKVLKRGWFEKSSRHQFLKPPLFCSFRGPKPQKGGGLRNWGVRGALRSEILKKGATYWIWPVWPNGSGVGLDHRASSRTWALPKQSVAGHVLQLDNFHREPRAKASELVGMAVSTVRAVRRFSINLSRWAPESLAPQTPRPRRARNLFGQPRSWVLC